ncbi:hypothetical protein [Azospirillum argentinense]|uniref:Lipoprotein n=1 Tax=Azospirillum argentinense TaxID=2970906 RepID=A0A4D8PFP7_9PROT|nr:hypothetical protein [Azospirillum argentinense]QCN97392.1 hypothetical protein D3093_19295 [Azospirillum argentinense]
MKKVAVLAVSILLVAGCNQTTYWYKDKKNLSKEEFQRVFVADRENDMSNIKPLTKPVTTRRLLVAIPSRSGYYANRLAVAQAGAPNATVADVEAVPANDSWYWDYANMRRWVERKNIYPAVEEKIVDNPGAFQPSNDYDVLALTVQSKPGQRDQWHYYSQRNGKQTVSPDSSASDTLANWESMLDAIKAAAIQ